jgi:hypothetical protein
MAIKYRRKRWAGSVARTGIIDLYKTVVGRLQRKRSFRRPGRRCENNIKMYLAEQVLTV